MEMPREHWAQLGAIHIIIEAAVEASSSTAWRDTPGVSEALSYEITLLREKCRLLVENYTPIRGEEEE
tara:strand:+ start:573 stop:776 length:204 start_codon:yes stop_codon:yes gene_type:complete